MRDSSPPRPEAASRPRGAAPGFGVAQCGVVRREGRHGQIVALSMMKDEAPRLIEWVSHHLAVGFSDLVVYTNDCTDGTDAMLDRLEALGLVHHRRNVIAPGQRPQPSALSHAATEPVVCQADWLLVLDADEFLSIRLGDGTVEGLLDAANARGATGIVATWRLFGSGGIQCWSPAAVTEQFVMAAPEGWNKGWGVKTLYRHDPACWKLGIHRPKMKTRLIGTAFPDSVLWLNGSGAPMEDWFKFRGWRSISRTVGHDWVQMNHYAVQSAEAFALRRLRGNVNLKADKYNAAYWGLQDRNEVRDDTLLRQAGRRSVVEAALLADPVLGELHARAVSEVEARLQALRLTEGYARLMEALAAASAVPIAEVVATPPQPRDPARIAARMTEVEVLRGAAAREARKAEARTGVAAMRPSAYRSAPAPAAAVVAWAATQGVRLPLDPGIFTAAALRAIESGKFERGLARRLPGALPGGLAVHEIGAGCGFVAALLARARPELALSAEEREPGLRACLDRVLAENGAGAVRVTEPGGPVTAGVLILGGEDLPDAVPPSVTHIVAYGRALLPAARIFAGLQGLGWQPFGGFDASVALALARPDPSPRPETP